MQSGSAVLLLLIGLLVLYVIATNRGACVGGAFACLASPPSNAQMASKTVSGLPTLPTLAAAPAPVLYG
jgi:hypothetical protein